jgi:hypothetical protein
MFFSSYVFYCGTSETINLCIVCEENPQFVSTKNAPILRVILIRVVVGREKRVTVPQYVQ